MEEVNEPKPPTRDPALAKHKPSFVLKVFIALFVLFVLVIIYFFFSFSSILSPHYIRMTRPFEGDNLMITSQGVSFEMKNILDPTVEVTNITIVGCGTYFPYSDSFIMAKGDRKAVKILCDLESGDDFYGNLRITSNFVGDTVPHVSSHHIKGKVS